MNAVTWVAPAVSVTVWIVVGGLALRALDRRRARLCEVSDVNALLLSDVAAHPDIEIEFVRSRSSTVLRVSSIAAAHGFDVVLEPSRQVDGHPNTPGLWVICSAVASPANRAGVALLAAHDPRPMADQIARLTRALP